MAAHFQPGTYTARIVEQGLTRSKQKKTLGIVLKVQLTGKRSPETGEVLGCEDYVRKITLWATDNTVDRIIEQLRALGFNGVMFKQLNPDAPDYHSLAGVETDVECSHETNEGEVWERWELPRAGGGKPIENDSSVAKELDALFGKKLKASAPEPEPVAAVSSTAPPNDEVPF